MDYEANAIYMEYLKECATLKHRIASILLHGNGEAARTVATKIGQLVASLHSSNIVHGDLTTSNILVRARNHEEYDLVLIDFGLTVIESAHNPEDKGERSPHIFHRESALVKTKLGLLAYNCKNTVEAETIIFLNKLNDMCTDHICASNACCIVLGVDLYVLERAFLSTHPNTESMFQAILDSYVESYSNSKDVIAKLDEVRLRGRKRTMVG